MRSNGNRLYRRVVGGVALAMLASGSFVEATAQPPVPPRKRAQRLTLDEYTGKWVLTPPPVPGTEDGDLDIARQWLAREDYATALKVMKGWMRTYGPKSGRYPEGLYVQGAAYLGVNDYRAAHESFQKLLNDFPGSEYAEPALKADFTVGEQYLAGKRRKAFFGLFRVKDREGGVKIMDDLVANYSDTPLAEMAQMSKADYYYARGDFELAEDEYAAFVTMFPLSGWRARAQLYSGLSALNGFPGVRFDDAGLVEAQERLRSFRREYPQAAEQSGVPGLLDEIAAKRAETAFERGRFYDKSRRFKAAAYYYRATANSWPGTPAAARARARLIELGEPLTPGTTAPNVPPTVASPTPGPGGAPRPSPPGTRERTNDSFRRQIND
ncbi:MAG: outer membrane protein assembly factor BamD [Phycisphaerae bacterium]